MILFRSVFSLFCRQICGRNLESCPYWSGWRWL